MGLERFWGDFFDVRFYLIYLLRKNEKRNVIDLGCGPGVISYFIKSSSKIGIDNSFEALQKAKKLVPKMECIQASIFNLPIKENSMNTILSAHLVQAFPKDLRNEMFEEMQRISANGAEIFITWANLNSVHYNKKIDKNSKLLEFDFNEIKNFFENQFNVIINGYGPYSKKIMYLLKLVYKIPEKFIFEDFIHKLLLTKTISQKNKGCIIICKKRK